MEVKINKFKSKLIELVNTEAYNSSKNVQNAVSICFIVCSLVELGINENRKLLPEEHEWFNYGVFLAKVFDLGSEWEDLEVGYHQLGKFAKENGLF